MDTFYIAEPLVGEIERGNMVVIHSTWAKHTTAHTTSGRSQTRLTFSDDKSGSSEEATWSSEVIAGVDAGGNEDDLVPLSAVECSSSHRNFRASDLRSTACDIDAKASTAKAHNNSFDHA